VLEQLGSTAAAVPDPALRQAYTRHYGESAEPQLLEEVLAELLSARRIHRIDRGAADGRVVLYRIAVS
jgi:hypothetical protein